MISIGDILTSGLEIRKVIGIENDYCITILLQDIDGAVDEDEDNIGEFVLLSDIIDKD